MVKYVDDKYVSEQSKIFQNITNSTIKVNNKMILQSTHSIGHYHKVINITQSSIVSSIEDKIHRYWWQMMKKVHIGDKFEMLDF